MTALSRITAVGIAAAAFLSTVVVSGQQNATAAGPNISAVDQVFGFPGQLQGDVYRVSFPRTDLTVTADGVTIKPGLALGSWAAFKRNGAAAVIHGDLVLTESEINPVISTLQASGFEITALHNHLIGETPHVMYLHYWGSGPEATLAQGLRKALGTTKTPLQPATAPSTPAAGRAGAAAPPAADPGFDVETLQRVLGRTGMVRGGVLGISVPRPEKITMMGVEMPPAMGMATALNFQTDGAGKIAGTGDFVMIDDEVNPIAKALRAHGIAVTALHNHMLHGTPNLYFMHFWAHGTVQDVGVGLKAALDLLAK
ncbi:MAG: DUF1259 domain-containing protein [Vicinamibacterales bacterium]